MPKLLPLTGLLLAVLSGQVLAESTGTGTPGTSAQGTRGSVPASPISGTAPLPGLSPAAQEAAALDSPLTPDEIRELAKRLQATEQALSAPVTSVVPRISSLTVSLSPGASLPVLRLALNNASTVTFQDSTGAPWPLAAPPMNPNEHLFQINYIPDSPVFSVLPRTAWASGNVTVLLKGLEVPVIISLTSGDPDSNISSREIDARLDLRIPRQGPQAAAGPTPPARVALHDETLQAFLDGTPPDGARRLKVRGGPDNLRVWRIGDELYVRCRAMLRDEFEQTLSSADGTRLWKLPVTPLLTFSVDGRTVTASPELE